MPPIIAITASSKKYKPGRSSNNYLKTQQKAVMEKIIATLFCSEVICPSSLSMLFNLSFVSGEALKLIGKIKEVKIYQTKGTITKVTGKPIASQLIKPMSALKLAFAY